MTPLNAFAIAALIAILYWFASALPIDGLAKRVLAAIGAVAVIVLMLALAGVVHLSHP